MDDLAASIDYQSVKKQELNKHLLKNGTNTVTFSPGISGFSVNNDWYSLPHSPVMQNGQLSISHAGAEKVKSILNKPETPSRKQNDQHSAEDSLRVVLDPGHGGSRTGAEGLRNTVEKDINLHVAKHLAKILRKKGHSVFLTRNSDRVVARQYRRDLNQRIELLKQKQADIFVSIHANSAHSKQAKGVEVFIARDSDKSDKLQNISHRFSQIDRQENLVNKYHRFRNKSETLARSILDKLSAAAPTESRGVRERSFHVLRNAAAPAVLVETGFISNPQEAQLLSSSSYRKKVARAISKGIVQYSRKVK